MHIVNFPSKRAPSVGDFYRTRIVIWDGFGPVGITEKKNMWVDYEQLLRPGFSSFRGQKTNKKQTKNNNKQTL